MSSSSDKFVFSRKSADGQSVWYYFKRDESGQVAKCTKCESEIKTGGGSTKGLHVHLNAKHNIDLLKAKSSDASIGNTLQCPPVKKRLISSYFLPECDKSLPAVLARMTACDGLSFSVFCTSRDLRAALKAMGHSELPTSPNTIKNMVVGYAKRVREKVSQEIQDEKRNVAGFSLTFDEWTSNRNRRYMNINVHGRNGKFWLLGLVRVEGSMPADECIKLVQGRLQQHGICLYQDIVCITTDGASVMAKVGKILSAKGPLQQLCLAHGVQLSVLDVLYNRTGNSESHDINTAETTMEDITVGISHL
jgi:hypothetical protein